MTDKELKKLSRAELLEMLLQQTREVERLSRELEKAELLLRQRQLVVEQTGNLAQAALELNGIFEAAQATADQYLENIAAMESQTRRKCDEMIQNARAEARKFWEEIRKDIQNPYMEHMKWQRILNILDENTQDETQVKQ